MIAAMWTGHTDPRSAELTTATTLAFSASSMHLAFFLAMLAQPMIPQRQTGLAISGGTPSTLWLAIDLDGAAAEPK